MRESLTDPEKIFGHFVESKTIAGVGLQFLKNKTGSKPKFELDVLVKIFTKTVFFIRRR
jgi:hypothetical protein